MVVMQFENAPDFLQNLPWETYGQVLFVVLIGALLGFFVGRLTYRVLVAAGVDTAVEGMSFERSAQSLGTSTVDLLARLFGWTVFGVAILGAVTVLNLDTALFWRIVVQMVPQVFVAILVLIVGFVVADRAELVVSEHLRGVKLPEVAFLPRIVRYSVLYVAALISLGQIGVATVALLVLLFLYFFGIIVFGVVALWDFLRSGAAGVYLLLEQPYSIGDRIRIGESAGVVQEVDLFVTRVEDDDTEYVVPNRKVLREGVARER
ncbi:mechanosensitive ion channel domain-containing protein [Halorubellus sp. JP-L1]|uniref:mechanosensitive ion channel domain-containing protein n=1 Tax=Halorubellus sp. JP-L1 TaxID=2715753 RepID=UPI001F044E8F|nr:mechanosensitive ion channel domain-containing protein [Halorubellus sp. JP-L1]